jgi:hypothetical protein
MPEFDFNRLARIYNLPAILVGKADDPDGFRYTFMAAFVHKIMEKVHEAYLAKSEGGADDLGNRWAPLSTKYAQRKSSAWFLRKYPNSIPNAIMRLTDKLIQSWAPGHINSLRYLPPRNQVVEFNANLVRIYSEVEYSEFQSAKRPIIPDDIGPWISEAIAAGLRALVAVMKYLTK